MDTETKEKPAELQHQQDMLKKDMEAKTEIMESNNESALSKNEAAIERLRTDIENINAHTTKMMIFIGVVIGAIALILRFL
ncbi:MAG: hypothetical protein OXF09_08925 [Hyphomicrobiales bacterium]|nr:hypothetical protein [Hyphomicrobiales bacterium]MCY4039570.1 hypothetical protein [Hyphomicrobiales bacterium]